MEELKPMPPSSCPFTPIGFLERAATVYGDCPSIIYNNTTYTWSQTYRRCLKVASSLSSNGIKPGQVVSVVAPNVPAMYELQFAVPMSGAILNNINTRLDARTISILLRHSESKLVFVDYLSLRVILEALSLFPPETPCPALVLITDEEEEAPPPPSLAVDFCTYESMVEKGDPEFKWVQPQSEWDPVVLNYTSGTTSAPKGVVQSHRGTFTITIGSLIDWSLPKQAVYLWTLPIFHANGWSYPWGMAAVGGANICLRRVEAPTIYSLIKRHGVTHMCGAPVVLNMLTNSPNAERLQNPVQILTGGAPPPSAVLFRAESLGFVVSHGYGLTETAGLVTSCAWKPKWNTFPASERAILKSRQGVPIVGFTEMGVVDPNTGKSVERDGVSLGEVVLRGGSVMLGYFKDPLGTSMCMKDGWFYTGDVGVLHSDGYLEVKDRSKDVIISGGENISSVEIESVLYTHPAVNEAAVVARPDEFWGETPCAFVSLKHGLPHKPGEKDIIDYCREKMAHYMVPKIVVFKDELPKTSTGKIQKYLLREYAKVVDSSKVKMATGQVGSGFYLPLRSPRWLQTPFIPTPISTSICVPIPRCRPVSLYNFSQSIFFAKKRGSEIFSIFQKNQGTVLHQPHRLCNTHARFL
jgi:acyl-CoA synthetase (AMP-forming)/AMP-acid ligase II